jgi:hypothetical protein
MTTKNKIVECLTVGDLVKLAPCHKKARFYTNHIFKVSSITEDIINGEEVVRLRTMTANHRKYSEMKTAYVSFLEATEEDILDWKPDLSEPSLKERYVGFLSVELNKKEAIRKKRLKKCQKWI